MCWAVITDAKLASQLGLTDTSDDGDGDDTALPPIRMLIADLNYVRRLKITKETKPFLTLTSNYIEVYVVCVIHVC